MTGERRLSVASGHRRVPSQRIKRSEGLIFFFLFWPLFRHEKELAPNRYGLPRRGPRLIVSVSAPIHAEEAGAVQEEAGVAPISGMQIEQQNVPTASSKAPAGLLPIPDYSANIWTRQYLTGDWWGARSYLASKGV